MKQLQDTDAMPYGKQHKGIPMSEVPVRYLHWFWHEGGGKDFVTMTTAAGQVSDYIRRNKAAILKENDDLIWEW